ncbi:MAG: TonB-dependent receptor [Gammaproteobacteria bacterium]|nr:TonB-dependent receptor [Gammaproteobacteria bacterium]MDH5305367.1 TonB-dependent receptor [Gammaproteobacteria bacterium]
MKATSPIQSTVAIGVALALSGVSHAATLEEIIVTAQKREQDLQDVGVSITAFTGDQMEALGWDNSLDVADQTPGLTTTSNTGDPGNIALFSIRGVSQLDFAEGQEAPVAIYRDEAYVSSPGASGAPIFDIQRIEVLRGPQGTLYGRNATGGLVHFISNKPTEEFEGDLGVTAGDYGQIGVTGVLSGPLSDTVQGRLAFYSNQDDGYIKNRVGKDMRADDTMSVRGMLNFDIGDSSSLLLIGQLTELDTTGGVYNSVASTGAGSNVADRVYCTTDPSDYDCRYSSYGIFGFDDAVDDGQINFASLFEGDPTRLAGIDDGDGDINAGAFDFDSGVDRTASNITAIFETELSNGMGLTSVTDFTTSDKDYREDDDSTNSTYLNDGVTQHATYEAGADIDQFSQELRLDGDTDSMQWIAGVYFLDIKNSFYGAFKFPAFGAGFVPRFEATNSTQTISAFGQIDYALGDALTLTVGARWTQDDKDIDYLFVEDFTPGSGLLNDGERHRIFRTDEEWSGKVQLDWQATDDVLLYAGVNRGVKGGGFNTDTYGVQAPTLEEVGFDPEILTAYEIGAKTDFGNLRINGSVYSYDYDDFQAFFFEGTTSLLLNSKAKFNGAEVEAIYTTTGGWDFLFGVSVMDTDVDNSDRGVVNQNAALAPDLTANVLIRKAWDLAGGSSISGQVSANYSDERSFNTIQSEITTGNSYTNVSAGVQYVTADDKWELGASVNNLTDEEILTYTYDIVGYTIQVFAPPRWVSATVKYNF